MTGPIVITPETATIYGDVYDRRRTVADMEQFELNRNFILRVVHDFPGLVAFVRRNENQPYAVEFLKRLGES